MEKNTRQGLANQGCRDQSFNGIMSTQFWQPMDIPHILMSAGVISVIRIALSGADTPMTKKWPSVFGLLADKFTTPKKAGKFRENMFYACWHFLSFSTILYYMSGQEWVNDYVFNHDLILPWWSADIAPCALARFIYMTECGFWVSCLLFTGIETWREDGWVMIAHHFFTLALISLSWTMSIWRIGLLTMILHDVADVLLYSSKTLSYTKCPDFLTTICFAFFAVGFFITRNIGFSYYVIGAALVALPAENDERSWLMSAANPSRNTIKINLVPAICLECLHIYWMALIVRMAHRQIFKPKSQRRIADTRSDGSDVELAERSEDEDATPSAGPVVSSQEEDSDATRESASAATPVMRKKRTSLVSTKDGAEGPASPGLSPIRQRKPFAAANNEGTSSRASSVQSMQN